VSNWNGWPADPLTAGAHWVRERVTGKIKPMLWRTDDDATYSPHNAARLFDYLGPCLTPAEVAAREASAWRAGRDAAERAIYPASVGQDDVAGMALLNAAVAIRALTLPADLAAAQEDTRHAG
jgi:hypothetical protein